MSKKSTIPSPLYIRVYVTWLLCCVLKYCVMLHSVCFCTRSSAPFHLFNYHCFFYFAIFSTMPLAHAMFIKVLFAKLLLCICTYTIIIRAALSFSSFYFILHGATPFIAITKLLYFFRVLVVIWLQRC